MDAALTLAMETFLEFEAPDYGPEGVASVILRRLLADVRAENPALRRLTLNSSPYGLPFYLRAGFQPADEERTINGICFTAMVYDL